MLNHCLHSTKGKYSLINPNKIANYSKKIKNKTNKP